MSNYWLWLFIIVPAAIFVGLALLVLRQNQIIRQIKQGNSQVSSEELFQTYIKSIPFGIARTDQNGIILAASSVLLEIFDYDSTKDMIGKNIADFVIPADREIFLDNYKNQPFENHSGFNQYQAVRKDGSIFFVETTFSRVENIKFDPCEMMVIIQDVTERRRIEDSEIRARKTAEALQAVGLVINSILDYSQMLNLMLEQISRVLTFDVASILMKDHDEVYIAAVRGFENPGEIINRRFSLVDESPNILVLKQRKPVIVTDVQEHFPSFKKSISHNIQSWLGIPLFSRDEIIGFLNLDSIEPDHFTDYDKQTAEAFANQVAIALENAHLYTESQRRLKEQAIQNEIARSLSIKLDTKEFYDMLYKQISQFIDIGTFIIASYEPGSENWETVYYRKNDLQLEPFTTSLTDGFSGHVIQTRTPIFLHNSEMVEQFSQETGRNSVLTRPKSIMVIPLIVSDKVLGVMGAQNDEMEEAYSQGDFNLFTSIGSQIAVAFENTRLFTRMEQLAMVDNLTGIFNRRHFFLLAQREFERAERYDRPFAVIMLDIDHFKRVNDSLGHSAGDQTLQAIAKLCERTIRRVDLIGRYGGEEFSIILPETNLEQARAAAERLRKVIEEFEVVTHYGTVHLTVSLGISARSSQHETLAAMIDRADGGLYAAKDAGRNRVGAIE